MVNRLALLIGLFFLTASSQAEIIQWEVKAGITGFSPDMIGYANLGDVITIRYSFESNTPDFEPWIAERGKFDGAVTSAKILLNTTHASLENVGYIMVLNDYLGRDTYLTSSTASSVIGEALPSYNGFEFAGYNLFYHDYDASMFSEASLTSAPIIAGYDSFRLNLGFQRAISPGFFLGAAIVADDLISISRIPPIPEPKSIWLLVTGLLCLASFRKIQPV